MVKSIQQFTEKGIINLEKVREGFMKNPKDMASLVYGIRDEVITLGLDIIRETLEDCDQMLRESGVRRTHWDIVKRDKKKLTTSLGTLEFEKTLFRNKESKERVYLLDSLLGLESHERLSEDAVARLLEEAVQSSYRRGGEETSLTDQVSKQTVKNRIHQLSFPEEEAGVVKKKAVEYLYIDADEDHVSLQFREKKGDLVVGANHQKNNCVLAKLVYVYEGIEPEAPKSKRHRLINPHYFSGTYDGENNAKLWEEIYKYLERHYDLAKVKKIYLNADGGAWIKGGKNRIAGITSVLDEFHLQKYLLKMTGHMKDSAEEGREQLCQAIRGGTKAEFMEVMERIVGCTDNEKAQKRIRESGAYILTNWGAAKLRLKRGDGVRGCSAEGHVSHVLSSRMSSRPMGWSRKGVDRMAHLRAYYYNGGDMLELVREQKKEEVKVANGGEEVISAQEMLRWEKRKQSQIGKYAERMNHRVGWDIRKQVWFKSHIWGL